MVQAGFYSDVVECQTVDQRFPGSILGQGMSFSSPVAFSGSVWVPGLGSGRRKVHVLLFFRCSDQIRGRIWLSGGRVSKDDHVAQLAECSRGGREDLGSSPDRATNFSSPVAFRMKKATED